MTDLVDLMASWAERTAVFSLGFGCYALHECFRAGRTDPSRQGIAVPSLTLMMPENLLLRTMVPE